MMFIVSAHFIKRREKNSWKKLEWTIPKKMYEEFIARWDYVELYLYAFLFPQSIPVSKYYQKCVHTHTHTLLCNTLRSTRS